MHRRKIRIARQMKVKNRKLCRAVYVLDVLRRPIATDEWEHLYMHEPQGFSATATRCFSLNRQSNTEYNGNRWRFISLALILETSRSRCRRPPSWSGANQRVRLHERCTSRRPDISINMRVLWLTAGLKSVCTVMMSRTHHHHRIVSGLHGLGHGIWTWTQDPYLLGLARIRSRIK